MVDQLTKLKFGDQWLREFGKGVTDDPAKAHDFTQEEAQALMCLHPAYDVAPGESFTGNVLHDKNKPPFNPGDGMVWVRYNGCWLAADRQALFLGTQRALKAHGVQEPMLA